MKHFTKERPVTEIMEFNAKFKNAKKTYKMKSDGISNIIDVKTDDKEIIKWLKEHGFEE
jgi:hypothetical protein